MSETCLFESLWSVFTSTASFCGERAEVVQVVKAGFELP